MSNVSKKRQTERLIATYGLSCVWCGKTCNPDTPKDHPDHPTREHMIPRVFGGANAFENLRLACLSCNHERGHGTRGKWALFFPAMDSDPERRKRQSKHATPLATFEPELRRSFENFMEVAK